MFFPAKRQDEIFTSNTQAHTLYDAECTLAVWKWSAYRCQTNPGKQQIPARRWLFCGL